MRKFQGLFVCLLVIIILVADSSQLASRLYQNLGVIAFSHVAIQKRITPTGVGLIDDADLNEAITDLNQALIRDPWSVSASRLMATLFFVQHDFKSAEFWSLRTLQRTSDPITSLRLGFIYLFTERPAEAMIALRQADVAPYLLNQVTARRLAGDLVGALEMYHWVSQLDAYLVPTDLQVEMAGIYYYTLGQKGEAEREFLAAAQQSVKDGRDKQTLAYGELGIYYAREKHCNGEAIQALQHAVALTPDAANYRLWLGWCYKEIGLLDQAQEELLRASETSDEYIRGTAYLRLGETYELAREWEKAIRAFNMAVELLPGNIECRTYLARAYQEAGQLDDALREYQSLLETYPDNEELRARYNEPLQCVNGHGIITLYGH